MKKESDKNYELSTRVNYFFSVPKKRTSRKKKKCLTGYSK